MPIESALVILIPEVEVLVESFRNRYDPSAALGVPAHVTVLYPFKPPSELTPDVITTLTEMFSRVSSFDAHFTSRNFFLPNILYLAPEPDAPFRRLTEIVSERFPENPPYGGEFKEIIPHLTVAQADDSLRLGLIATEFDHQAKSFLPINSLVREVALLDNESGRWQVRKKFDLGNL